MKKTAKNLMGGMSLRVKPVLIGFSLLAIMSLPGGARADLNLNVNNKISQISINEAKPFFKLADFINNENVMPNLDGKYWLEKNDLTTEYKINLLNYTTNLKDGLYPVMLQKSPQEDLRTYYIKEFSLDNEEISEIIKGVKPFAYIKINSGQAKLISSLKNDDSLTLSSHFPVGEYMFSMTDKDTSNRLADWQFRVVDYPAKDILAVETAYDSLDLGDTTQIKDNIVLPEPSGVKISWQSSNEDVISKSGKVFRPAFVNGNKDVVLTATISSGEFLKTKKFDLTVIKNDPIELKVNGFIANGKQMKDDNNEYFILAKKGTDTSYLIDFNKGYESNLQDGKYAIRFNDLSLSLKKDLNEYYSNSKYSEAEIEGIINGTQPCAYIEVVNKTLRLISVARSSAVGKVKLNSITSAELNKPLPLSISNNYPNGLYSLVVDLDGIDGTTKIKWQLEIINLDEQAVQTDLDNLSFNDQITGDIYLPLTGINGSNIAWESDKPLVIDNLGKVHRSTIEDVVVTLKAILSKGLVSQEKTFNLTVLKDIAPDVVVVPPAVTTGGGG
ncbi:MAG: hypothetical protein EOM88_04275, partial [Clostridia bacterium]|nr:hypothetical protein [Clostridia bacterium]